MSTTKLLLGAGAAAGAAALLTPEESEATPKVVTEALKSATKSGSAVQKFLYHFSDDVKSLLKGFSKSNLYPHEYHKPMGLYLGESVTEIPTLVTGGDEIHSSLRHVKKFVSNPIKSKSGYSNRGSITRGILDIKEERLLIIDEEALENAYSRFDEHLKGVDLDSSLDQWTKHLSNRYDALKITNMFTPPGGTEYIVLNPDVLTIFHKGEKWGPKQVGALFAAAVGGAAIAEEAESMERPISELDTIADEAESMERPLSELDKLRLRELEVREKMIRLKMDELSKDPAQFRNMEEVYRRDEAKKSRDSYKNFDKLLKEYNPDMDDSPIFSWEDSIKGTPASEFLEVEKPESEMTTEELIEKQNIAVPVLEDPFFNTALAFTGGRIAFQGARAAGAGIAAAAKVGGMEAFEWAAFPVKSIPEAVIKKGTQTVAKATSKTLEATKSARNAKSVFQEVVPEAVQDATTLAKTAKAVVKPPEPKAAAQAITPPPSPEPTVSQKLINEAIEVGLKREDIISYAKSSRPDHNLLETAIRLKKEQNEMMAAVHEKAVSGSISITEKGHKEIAKKTAQSRIQHGLIPEEVYTKLGEKAGIKYQQVYNTEAGDLIGFHDPVTGGDFSVAKTGITLKKVKDELKALRKKLPPLTEEELAEVAKTKADDKAYEEMLAQINKGAVGSEKLVGGKPPVGSGVGKEEPITSAEEALRRGIGKRYPEGMSGKPPIDDDLIKQTKVGLEREYDILLTQEAKETQDALDIATELDEKYFGGIPGLGETIERIKNTKFYKELSYSFRSPENATRNKHYKNTFKYHRNQFLTKEKVSAEVLNSLPHNPLKMSEGSMIKIGKALEDPSLMKNLNKEELDMHQWYKSFYKGAFNSYITRFGGEKADLIMEVAKNSEYAKTSTKALGKKFNLTKNQERALQVARGEKEHYLPHTWERGALRQQLEDEKLALLNKGVSDKDPELLSINRLLNELSRDRTVGPEYLPKHLRSKFFERRYGKKGYSFDAHKAFVPYFKSWLREMFDEPAMQEWNRFFRMGDKEVPQDVKDYGHWFLKEYLGLDNRSSVWANIRAVEWTRTLGMSTSSALVNLTQNINTIADIGPMWTIRGALKAGTAEGRARWKNSGLAEEVYQVMYPTETGINSYIEKARRITGFLFTKAEQANRSIAYNAYFEKFLHGLKGSSKMTEGEALAHAHFAGAAGMHKTQYPYGAFGMPKALRGWSGTALQFSSFPIKTMEFIEQLFRENPAKGLAYLGILEGTRLTAQELLDTDISNQLGIGINYGQAMEFVKNLSEGDLKEAFLHMQLVRRGEGMLPYGFGPIVNQISEAIKGMSDEGAWLRVRQNLAPVQWRKLQQFYAAIKNKRGSDEYPIYTDLEPLSWGTPGKKVRYFLNLEQLTRKTFFFPPMGPMAAQPGEEGLKETEAVSARSVSDELMKNTLSDAYHAMITGDDRTLSKILDGEHMVVPTSEGLTEAVKKQHLSDYERMLYDRQKEKSANYYRSMMENW